MPTPALSVCLPTDTVDTLRGVLERLRAQTIAASIEVVIPTPDGDAARAAVANESRFAAVRIVDVPALLPLGRARDAAVRAATAPYIFLGETHSFAQPEWAAMLLARHEEGWAVVVPGFANANPRGVLSWSGFLMDYGAWAQERPSGELQYWPLNNASYRRSVLLECGDDLAHSLGYGDQLLISVRARGHRIFFEPRAGLHHLNVSRLGPWLDERRTAGVVIARYRSSVWSTGKRLAYVLASPLIPFVLFRRVAPTVLATIRARRLPLATLPVMFLGALAHGFGEFLGYARLTSSALAETQMAEYEIHKTRYAGRAAP